MLNITNRAKNVSPSLTLAITAKANKLKERGVDIVSFAAGEPDFNTPEFIVNAAKDALDKGLTKYTPASGIAPLKKAVCAKLKRDNALDYQPEQIVISTGAKQSLFNALQTVCQEGDEVIIISPYWLTYPELIKICGAKPVVVETKAEEGFALNVGLIEKAVTDKTRALILNMPNNPSGGHVQCANGQYTTIVHNIIKMTKNVKKSPIQWIHCMGDGIVTRFPSRRF